MSEKDPGNLKALVDYFVEKFNISEQDVEDAIQKTGTSSENLEQYFNGLAQQHQLPEKNK